MPRSIDHSAAVPITSFLRSAQSQSIKHFTQTLHSLEKEYGLYPRFQAEDAIRLFYECRSLVEYSQKNLVRYNALRLLKYVVTTEDFIRVHAEDVWTLFRTALFDPDGNVRNAGVQLFSRYHFGLSLIADPWEIKRRKRGKKKQEEMDFFQKMLVDQFLELYELEASYAKDHADEEELWKKSAGRVTPSWETKDKILKAIRRALEECSRGLRLEELAAKHGYKLPNHWVLDSFVPDDDSGSYSAAGDLEAAAFSAGGTTPLYISDPPNPKNFKTFEEYQEALAIRESFEWHVETVNKIMSSGKSDEEVRTVMATLGYEHHLDAPCLRPLCEERYGCVSRNLIYAQRFFVEHILETSLQPENALISEEEIYKCEEELCRTLPEEWFVEGSRKQCSLRWFLDLFDWLSWNDQKKHMEELALEPVFAAFLREVYRWTLHVLRDRPLPSSWKGEALIGEFLQMTHLLDTQDAKELLESFQRQQ